MEHNTTSSQSTEDNNLSTSPSNSAESPTSTESKSNSSSEEIKITSLADFIKELKELQSNLPSDCTYYYRGHAHCSWEMKPSIVRTKEFLQNENAMYKELLTHRPEDFRECSSAFSHLVKMQHYGLPTRLLDLTSNPLVALYFACLTETSKAKQGTRKEGEVIVLCVPNTDIKYYDSDTVSIISNLAACKYGKEGSSITLPKRKKFTEVDLEEFNKQENISYLLHQIRTEKPHFQAIINPNDLSRAWVVKAQLENDRIKKQSGLFIIFGATKKKIEGDKKNVELDFYDMPDIPKEWGEPTRERLIIPQAYKEEILKELASIGITKNFIYPELDTFADELKKKYIPKEETKQSEQ